jgi:hypothetical protein
VTVPSTAARQAALTARASSLCVLALVVLGFVLSPQGALVLLAFLGFLLVPSLIGAAVLARAATRLRLGADALAQLFAGAVLLLPGGLFISHLGTGVFRDVDLSGREAVYGWASLVLAPAALLLGITAPALLWRGRGGRFRPVAVVGWANVVVLVVAAATVLSAPQPG